MSPKFSIIIPVYNVAPYLRECLDSVLAQTYTDWEAICVDDGSTDGSGAILDEYAEKDKRVKVIHQKNQGVAKAREVGLAAAKGEYIGWVDSDDTIEPEHFEKLYQAAEIGGYDLVWSDQTLIYPDKEVVQDQVTDNDSITLLKAILKRERAGTLLGKLFRRVAILSSGATFGDGRCVIMEDNYFLGQFLLSCSKIKHIPVASYRYLVRGGSLSNQGMKLEWWRQVVDANNAIYDLLIGRGVDVALKYRMSIFKIWLFFAKEVPDAMFYRFHPEIRWVPRGITTNVQRILMFVSTFHLRWLVKLLRKVVRR